MCSGTSSTNRTMFQRAAVSPTLHLNKHEDVVTTTVDIKYRKFNKKKRRQDWDTSMPQLTHTETHCSAK